MDVAGLFEGKSVTDAIFTIIMLVLSFSLVNMFDSMGTLMGAGRLSGLVDENGEVIHMQEALMADAISTAAGALMGTSTVTTVVESSAGIAEGGRTGLSSVVTGFLFLIAIIFAPVFTTIPGFATAPALIFVGFLMVSAVVEIDFNDLTESIPAYLCLICMPLMYSISEGIAVGVISYVIVNLVAGKAKKITPLMYVLALLFILKYIFL